jgi:ligand-binding SRPBCC domain-containing protein
MPSGPVEAASKLDESTTATETKGEHRMKTHTLRSAVLIARPVEEVFAFFSDAHNLEILTPPWLHFRTVTADPIVLAVGTRFRHRIRVKGIPLRWESEITAWEPPYHFQDEQLRGPYRSWRHDHYFSARGGGTLLEDHVEYSVLGGSVINTLLVEPDLLRVFEYRRRKMLEIFA